MTKVVYITRNELIAGTIDDVAPGAFGYDSIARAARAGDLFTADVLVVGQDLMHQAAALEIAVQTPAATTFAIAFDHEPTSGELVEAEQVARADRVLVLPADPDDLEWDWLHACAVAGV